VTFIVVPDALLPEGVGDGRRFATGDARRAGDAEALNLSHPLVTALDRWSRQKAAPG
jgi:hypothetical protein